MKKKNTKLFTLLFFTLIFTPMGNETFAVLSDGDQKDEAASGEKNGIEKLWPEKGEEYAIAISDKVYASISELGPQKKKISMELAKQLLSKDPKEIPLVLYSVGDQSKFIRNQSEVLWKIGVSSISHPKEHVLMQAKFIGYLRSNMRPIPDVFEIGQVYPSSMVLNPTPDELKKLKEEDKKVTIKLRHTAYQRELVSANDFNTRVFLRALAFRIAVDDEHKVEFKNECIKHAKLTRAEVEIVENYVRAYLSGGDRGDINGSYGVVLAKIEEAENNKDRAITEMRELTRSVEGLFLHASVRTRQGAAEKKQKLALFMRLLNCVDSSLAIEKRRVHGSEDIIQKWVDLGDVIVDDIADHMLEYYSKRSSSELSDIKTLISIYIKNNELKKKLKTKLKL